MKTTTESPLGHLTPFVVAIARKRIEDGESLTPELMTECVKQAVEEDNARCEMVLGQGDGARRLYPDQRAALNSAICESVYNSIPKAAPKMNPRWVAFEKHLGRKPTTVEYLTSQKLINELMAQPA